MPFRRAALARHSSGFRLDFASEILRRTRPDVVEQTQETGRPSVDGEPRARSRHGATAEQLPGVASSAIESGGGFASPVKNTVPEWANDVRPPCTNVKPERNPQRSKELTEDVLPTTGSPVLLLLLLLLGTVVAYRRQ